MEHFNQSIRNVASIEIEEVGFIDNINKKRKYYREIDIRSEAGNSFSITLWSENKEALESIKMR